MINILLLLLFLTCIGITAAWVAENPGNVTIHWFDYRIDTSFAFMMLVAILAAVALAYAYIVVRRLILMPIYFSKRRTVQNYEKGLAELTYSIAALAATDTKDAELHTRKAEKLLGRTPLTLLLSAQIARSQGDDAKTHLLLTQMLDHKETEYLAARSLSESAGKKQQLSAALSLAQRAHKLNPRDIVPLVSLHIRLGEWQQAIQAIDKAVRKGKITRNDMRRYRGIVYLQQGMQLLETGHTETALIAAKRCLKLLPSFTPSVLFAAKAFAANGQKHKATKLILHAWKENPHKQLAELFSSVISTEPKAKQVKMVHKFFAIHPETPTSDASWICDTCGQATPQWKAHCPSCDGFDTLEWKQRELKFVG